MTEYFDSKDNTFKPIPDAKWYVVSEDKFMSGWGRAIDKKNLCVIPCDDLAEAERVETYIQSRAEQKRIRIVAKKPKTKPNVIYSLLLEWKNK